MNMHPKQAKYAVLSGQLAPIGQEMAKKLNVPKKAMAKNKLKVSRGERTKGRSIRSTFGGDFS